MNQNVMILLAVAGIAVLALSARKSGPVMSPTSNPTPQTPRPATPPPVSGQGGSSTLAQVQQGVGIARDVWNFWGDISSALGSDDDGTGVPAVDMNDPSYGWGV